jgi:molecular chaperone GrpE
MSEPTYGFNCESSATSADDAGPTEDAAAPEFGLIDVIEAFTAMRHDWRVQTKESRVVAESIQAAVGAIQDLQSKLPAPAADSSLDASRPLAQLLAETDHQLTRAVDGVRQAESSRRQRDEADAHAVREYFASMSALARWFARPLLELVMKQRIEGASPTEDPALEGLNLILARLRRAMKQQHVERFDAVGQAFDASTMNAIGAVVSDEYPAGHVAEQLSPGYRWRGQILRFAEVRVTIEQS